MACRVGRTTLSVLLALMPATASAQSHIRPLFPRAKSALAAGLRRSETFRSLVHAVDRSNVIVHVVDGGCPDFHARACTTMLSHNADVRYLRITIAQFLPAEAIVALLAHELQHVVTIAGNDEVANNRQLETFFERSGWSLGPHSFETRDAVAVSVRVAHEMTGGSSATAGRSRN